MTHRLGKISAAVLCVPDRVVDAQVWEPAIQQYRCTATTFVTVFHCPVRSHPRRYSQTRAPLFLRLLMSLYVILLKFLFPRNSLESKLIYHSLTECPPRDLGNTHRSTHAPKAVGPLLRFSFV
jgi:hypothetical protein